MKALNKCAFKRSCVARAYISSLCRSECDLIWRFFIFDWFFLVLFFAPGLSRAHLQQHRLCVRSLSASPTARHRQLHHQSHLVTGLSDRTGHYHSRLCQGTFTVNSRSDIKYPCVFFFYFTKHLFLHPSPGLRSVSGCLEPYVLLPAPELQNPRRYLPFQRRREKHYRDHVVGGLHVHTGHGRIQQRSARPLLRHQCSRDKPRRPKGKWD